MAKGTRITVDLGSKELLKAVKFASVEQGKPIREIIIEALEQWLGGKKGSCLLYTSPSPRDRTRSRMPSSA